MTGAVNILALAALLLTALPIVARGIRILRGNNTPAPYGTRAEWRWILRTFTRQPN
jgi:hypothetical protein